MFNQALVVVGLFGYNVNFSNLLRNLPVLDDPLDNPDLFIEILEDLPGDGNSVRDERVDDVVPTEETTTEEPTNSNEETIKKSSENVSSEEYVEFEEDSSDSKATEADFKEYFKKEVLKDIKKAGKEYQKKQKDKKNHKQKLDNTFSELEQKAEEACIRRARNRHAQAAENRLQQNRAEVEATRRFEERRQNNIPTGIRFEEQRQNNNQTNRSSNNSSSTNTKRHST